MRRIVWPGIALQAALALCGCSEDGPFSDAEMAILRGYVLTAVPRDDSNRHADDVAAAKQGK